VLSKSPFQARASARGRPHQPSRVSHRCSLTAPIASQDRQRYLEPAGQRLVVDRAARERIVGRGVLTGFGR
jgi:hypothetical protein